MKLTKSLFMLCAAGLSLCACNSDDKLQVSDGYGDVIIKILPPETNTRTVIAGQSGNDNDKVQIEGTYKVSLTAAAITNATGENSTYHQDGTVTFTQVVYADDKTSHQVTFTGVKNPIKVAVSLNDGVADYSAVAIETLNGELKKPTAAPAYGESTDFSKTTISGNLTTYNVSIQMAIPIARLEIGNITYSEGASSLFSQLTVGGIYLDKLRDKGSVYSAGDFVSQETKVIDYQFGTTENEHGSGITYVLGDNAPAPSVDFVANPTASLPGDSKVYAYNFYGATSESVATKNNPYFKIYFSSTQLKSEATPTKRYAMITRYTDGINEIALENGKIYRITNIALADENILLDEENNSTYSVEVTVQEARWTIADINGAWAQ